MRLRVRKKGGCWSYVRSLYLYHSLSPSPISECHVALRHLRAAHTHDDRTYCDARPAASRSAALLSSAALHARSPTRIRMHAPRPPSRTNPSA